MFGLKLRIKYILFHIIHLENSIAQALLIKKIRMKGSFMVSYCPRDSILSTNSTGQPNKRFLILIRTKRKTTVIMFEKLQKLSYNWNEIIYSSSKTKNIDIEFNSRYNNGKIDTMLMYV